MPELLAGWSDQHIDVLLPSAYHVSGRQPPKTGKKQSLPYIIPKITWICIWCSPFRTGRKIGILWFQRRIRRRASAATGSIWMHAVFTVPLPLSHWYCLQKEEGSACNVTSFLYSFLTNRHPGSDEPGCRKIVLRKALSAAFHRP